jgi:GNAT superfamily N-acetyltransferase
MKKVQFESMKNQTDSYYTIVIEDIVTGKVAGTGTLMVEKKFIHHCGKVGHIEDIVVSEDNRGQNLGRLIVETLIEVGKRVGCYKTLLNCLDKNVGFYEKCGMVNKEKTMASLILKHL